MISIQNAKMHLERSHFNYKQQHVIEIDAKNVFDILALWKLSYFPIHIFAYNFQKKGLHLVSATTHNRKKTRKQVEINR